MSDVVCGTESWFQTFQSVHLGYTMIRQDRTGNIGGEVFILVKK